MITKLFERVKPALFIPTFRARVTFAAPVDTVRAFCTMRMFSWLKMLHTDEVTAAISAFAAAILSTKVISQRLFFPVIDDGIERSQEFWVWLVSLAIVQWHVM